MEIILDTANIALIEKYNKIYNIAGVTSNPTIISREKADFFPLLEKIRKIIGNEKQLHVQVTETYLEGILAEAETICNRLGKNTYIKVPANEVGIAAMKKLKEDGFNVTATAIYTLYQGIMAANVGADYIAPYFNRMCLNNIDAPSVISKLSKFYKENSIPTKIVAASFKSREQIATALISGAHAVTASPELFTTMVEDPLIDGAIDGFLKDWKGVYGNKNICEL